MLKQGCIFCNFGPAEGGEGRRRNKKYVVGEKKKKMNQKDKNMNNQITTDIAYLNKTRNKIVNNKQ